MYTNVHAFSWNLNIGDQEFSYYFLSFSIFCGVLRHNDTSRIGSKKHTTWSKLPHSHPCARTSFTERSRIKRISGETPKRAYGNSYIFFQVKPEQTNFVVVDTRSSIGIGLMGPVRGSRTCRYANVNDLVEIL